MQSNDLGKMSSDKKSLRGDTRVAGEGRKVKLKQLTKIFLNWEREENVCVCVRERMCVCMCVSV